MKKYIISTYLFLAHRGILPVMLFIAFSLLINTSTSSQSFCFQNPNTGPHYHNGSSGTVYDVTGGDFNGDGHLDIVTANSAGDNISFIPGNGDGTLGSPDTFYVPGTLFCIHSADINNDGKRDIVTANKSHIFVLAGNGDGTFQPHATYAGGAFPSRISFTDLNGDNIYDIIEAAANGIFILLGQGNGTFAPGTLYSIGGNAADLVVADMDNDSKVDIVSTTINTSSGSYLSFLKGDGTGTFAAPVHMPVPHYNIFGINADDLDSNGTVDLIVINRDLNDPRAEIYLGNGDGTFASPVFYPTQFRCSYVYLEDLDNDGIKDIIGVESGGFMILKGKGDGTFDEPQRILSITSPNGLAIGDFNEDGRIDVVVPSGYWGSGLIGMNVNCTTLSIEEFSRLQDLNIYPNPASDKIYITFKLDDPANVSIRLLDPLGRIMASVNDDELMAGENTISFSMEAFPAGIYYIQLSADSDVATEQVVVMK